MLGNAPSPLSLHGIDEVLSAGDGGGADWREIQVPTFNLKLLIVGDFLLQWSILHASFDQVERLEQIERLETSARGTLPWGLLFCAAVPLHECSFFQLH